MFSPLSLIHHLKMNLIRGSWTATEDETTNNSPVRLLQKLTAFRASTGSTPVSSSPSPQNERKSTILSESTNFFTRLWRHSDHQTTPSQILLASHEIDSSSFDQIPEATPTATDSPSIILPLQKLNNRISLIRDVSPKHSSQPCPYLSFSSSSKCVQPPIPLQPQATNSSTVTDPSFEDTASEQPCDTNSEFFSQSFETNIDSSNPKLVDEQFREQIYEQVRQQELTYDQRQRSSSLSAKPVISLVQTVSSLPWQLIEQKSDSLTSPDASIDVSMVSSNYLLVKN